MNILKKLNEKSKSFAKKFFIETKMGIWLMASMAMLNAVEGLIHLVVAIIGTWGAVDVSVYDIRVWLPIIENFILGGFSLLTGWCLSVKHDHSHHGK
ncbi:hypothetical protein PQE75_gp167 [Bacillus phage vB_BcoS-136]|uniref:Uncharacterized protein n=1 Tax=Bacillus phage vB_BcoS-136 TaxID=2419619 RepID=A0A3G3BVL4_9CAUD|nr:hypothetical protein PQE75_gp167 [Bacillus phage vB_BcoS-136]AYP68312.1 hypothetical protein vBBcoS136_00198 [Bacillus phage vB_BcoS-136]